MRSIPQCMCRIGCDVVSCVSSPNDVCDDECVEQYQKYDVRYHVCFPISCVEEWAQYRNMWYLSTTICSNHDIAMYWWNGANNVVATHTHACRVVPTHITRDSSQFKPQTMRGKMAHAYLGTAIRVLI